MKVGIFGGTFNPIHYGHLRAAEEVRERLGFDRILFVPSGNPPLKAADKADALHRYEMARLALADSKYFQLSDIEYRLSGKSYTVKTIEALKNADPCAEFSFILGIDAFLDIPNWWHPGELIALTDFVVISRPGFVFMDLSISPYMKIDRRVLSRIDNKESETYRAKLKSGRTAILLRLTPVGISSTEVRRLVRQGRSIKYMLPADVQSYIITKKLYRRKNKLKVKS
jgi:nicotinate-nucleotide adenylyltransferase